MDAVDIEAVESALRQIAEGRYDSVPAGDDRLGRAVRALADTLQGQALDSMHRTVAYSIALNEEVLSVVALGREVHEIAGRGGAIAAATHAMTKTVGEIAVAGQSTFDEAEATAQAAARSMGAANQAVDTIESIARAVEEAASSVGSLAEISNEIAGMARSVETIARQTNLLALNAAIEATRAGAAGKGFAVVADEVKKLANQTREVAETIRSRTESLRQGMDAIVTDMEAGSAAVQQGRSVVAEAGREMEDVSARAARTAGLMQAVTGHVESQRQAADAIAVDSDTIARMTESSHQGIVALTDVIDHSHKLVVKGLATLTARDIPNKELHLAMSDHMLWRKRLAQTFNGGDGLREDELRDPRACRFGRWYYGSQPAKVSAHSAFAGIDAPNRAMHHSAGLVVDHVAAGRVVEAVAEMEAVGGYSEQILALLRQLAGDLDGGAN